MIILFFFIIIVVIILPEGFLYILAELAWSLVLSSINNVCHIIQNQILRSKDC